MARGLGTYCLCAAMTHETPITAIVTERLLIRSLRDSDHADLCAVFTDPVAMRFIGTTGATRSPEEVRERMGRMMELERERGLAFWAVELREADEAAGAPAGTVIGDCGLVPIAHKGPEIEIGYRLAQRFWGRGYATEAARAVLSHGFGALGLERIIAVTIPENYASQHVLSKIGMRRVGLTERYYETTTMLFEVERGAWALRGSHRPG